MEASPQRTPEIDAALLKILSKARLGRYLDETGGNLHRAISLHERNTRLSESFYTLLQSLELCLRNTIDARMSSRFGADWFGNGNAPLAPDATAAVEGALRKIKKPGQPAAHDIIAELKFAFWVPLLAPRYDATPCTEASGSRAASAEATCMAASTH